VSAPWIVILVVVLAAFGLLAAITANIVRSAIRVGKAAKQFLDEASPLIAELQAQGEQAAERVTKLTERSSSLRS
jgi:ABC-type Fe3+-hydroxamate transport system substrate-binding protein